MNTTDRFASLTPETAPDGSRSILAASHRQFGFLPSPVARAAHSPAVLAHLVAGFRAFDHGALSHTEREVVAMTVAFENECHYCMAMHSAMLAGDAANAPLVRALREGTPLETPRLEALRRFVRALIEGRGRASAEHYRALEAQGFTEAQVLDVILGVGVYVLSTFVNIATEEPLDAPFAAFAWTKPR